LPQGGTRRKGTPARSAALPRTAVALASADRVQIDVRERFGEGDGIPDAAGCEAHHRRSPSGYSRLQRRCCQAALWRRQRCPTPRSRTPKRRRCRNWPVALVEAVERRARCVARACATSKDCSRNLTPPSNNRSVDIGETHGPAGRHGHPGHGVSRGRGSVAAAVTESPAQGREAEGTASHNVGRLGTAEGVKLWGKRRSR
jgi:hypothetical protein